MSLSSLLDSQYHAFNVEHAVSDPVWRARRYTEDEDREVAAFAAAALAFGRVQSVLNAIDGLLEVMGPSPAAYVRQFEPRRQARALAHLGHRWTRAADLAALLWVLRQMLDADGSIEGFFMRGVNDDDEDVQGALESFSARALAFDVSAVYGGSRPRPGVAYFFATPASGGACKRLNLFLRWMVRRDAVDMGVWTRLPASRLVVPLDTHVIRVGRCLGLTRYTSPGWRMAADITRSLRRLDPVDPVKYDFSLCHIGMMSACGFGKAHGDANCPLRGACRPLGRPRRKTAGRPS